MDDTSRIATKRVGPDIFSTSKPATQYHMGDHLGSSNVVIAGDGTPINREEYRPYGETSFGSYEKKRYRFSGKERDEESGLYYHGARYYAPWLARWTAPDPAGMVDGVNLYEYVRGNPVRLVDPDGRESDDVQHATEVATGAAENVAATASRKARSNASFGTRVRDAARIALGGITGSISGAIRGTLYHTGGILRSLGPDNSTGRGLFRHGLGLIANTFAVALFPIATLILAGSVLSGNVPVGRELTEEEAGAMNVVYSEKFDVSSIRVYELKGTWLEILVSGGDWMVLGTNIFSPGGIPAKDEDGNIRTDDQGNPIIRSYEMTRGLAVHEGAHVWQFSRMGPGYLLYAAGEHLFSDSPYDTSGYRENFVDFHMMGVESQADFLRQAYERGIFKDLEQIPEENSETWVPRWDAHDSVREYFYYKQSIREGFQRRSPW